MTSDKTLIEVKYNSEMNVKQKYIFNSISSKNKIEIKNIYELNDFLKSSTDLIM